LDRIKYVCQQDNDLCSVEFNSLVELLLLRENCFTFDTLHSDLLCDLSADQFNDILVQYALLECRPFGYLNFGASLLVVALVLCELNVT